MRTIEELIDGIRARHDELDALAADADALGTAPAALVDIMRDLRIPLVKAPAEVGGDELCFAHQQRYFEALSYSNTTAGWTGFNHAGSASMAGALLSDPGIEALFGSADPPFMAAVAAPSGTFDFVDGGLELTGTYRFASGVRHAQWILVPAIERADEPSIRLMAAPTAEADVSGDWDVMALKGTGSVDTVFDKAFVPEHLVVDPFAGPVRGGPMYTVGMQAYVSGENLGFTLGTCQRFLDELTRYANAKPPGEDRLADRGAFHYELGKGQLQVNAARAYGLSALTEADTQCAANGGLTAAEEQRVVAMMAYSTESSANAISYLFHFAGAHALFDSNILQRLFRDAHGSVQHKIASNVVYDRFGQTLLSEAGDDDSS